MTITLYNTKTRRKEDFAPIDRNTVRMYVCGPTVYDRAHLGNARAVVVFDMLYRLLRHEFGAEHVRYVRNFTDVDDKINDTALARQQAGAEGTLEQLIAERTEETISWYLADMGALGALEPTDAPRATAYIAPMVAMIEELIAGGHAYAKEGHVLFRVRSYKDYGKLSGRSVDDMIAGARVEVAPFKEDPMDFVLWKPSSGDQPGWASPWGRGRPGWHIECSAMAAELLGETFDIHGGGNDLTFPHHENEIAQSACVGHGFANVWMHNEMLQVEGKKMSKSLGNFFTVRDLLEQGVPGEVVRFVMLSTHYRKPMDWTEKKRAEAEKTLRKWYELVGDAKPPRSVDPHEHVVERLSDDLNTHGALMSVKGLADDILHNEKIDQQFEAGGPYAPQPTQSTADLRATFKATLQLLGLMGDEVPGWAVARGADLSQLEEHFTKVRAEAMLSKDFTEVDRLKSVLIAAGVEVQMGKDKVTLKAPLDFDPSQVEGL